MLFNNHHIDEQPPCESEKDDLLLRLALTERKLSLALQKLDSRNQELSSIQRLAETIRSERQINRLCEKTTEEMCKLVTLPTIKCNLVTAQAVRAKHSSFQPFQE